MLVALGFVLASSFAQESVRSIRYFEMEPTPYGEILLSKPVLEWKIWGEGVGIKEVEASIDERSVRSGYSKERSAVVASIDEPLAYGRHRAKLKVSFASGHKVEKSWDFKVAKGAIESFPSYREVQSTLVRLVNNIRRKHSLSPVLPSEPLTAAAQAHVEYMAANGTTGHKEVPRGEGYTGSSPGERARAFGYYERNGEAVAVSSAGYLQSLEDLFVAPYHRVMFLQPGRPDFGAGQKGDATCIKFGGRHENALVVSPSDGSVGVPRDWDGIETPDPMEGSAFGGPYGYPLVLAAFGSSAEGLSLKSAQLKDATGKSVATRVLHPGNDPHAKSSVIMIPLKPLKANAEYIATIVVRSNGKAQKRTSRFKTAQ